MNSRLWGKTKSQNLLHHLNFKFFNLIFQVQAVASGSIPIVAGRDGKPNYLRFMPKNSYINVYDYETVDELVKRIKAIAASKEEYAKYTRFKQNGRNYTREWLKKLPLTKLINEAKSVMNSSEDSEFFKGLIAKEKSENKLCKIGRYLTSNTPEQINKDIRARRAKRPQSSAVCLKQSNLVKDFKIKESFSIF
jgi:hypothetical protein